MVQNVYLVQVIGSVFKGRGPSTYHKERHLTKQRGGNHFLERQVWDFLKTHHDSENALTSEEPGGPTAYSREIRL